MTSGTKKAVWIVGLLAGAAGIGGIIYAVSRPKQPVGTTPKSTPLPPTGGPTPTFISPTATPGIFAAVSAGRNVSWIDGDGKPVVDTSTARVPR